MSSRLILSGMALLASLVFAAPTLALDVYIMSGGDAASDQAVVDALSARGHTPTLGVQSITWDGTQASLGDFDAVVVINNQNWNGGSMPTAGQTALLDYATNGGGVVTTEWLIWNIYSGGRHQNLDPMVPATGGLFNSASSATYTQLTPDPVISNGLPGSFSFPLNNFSGSESFLAAKAGATVFYSSTNSTAPASSWHGLVGWGYGLGRVISFSTFASSIEMANTTYARLFVNAVEWAGGVQPPRIGHFLCYQAKTTRGAPKFQPVVATLSDQFESAVHDVSKPASLCTPADKREEGILDPDTHLKGYQITLTGTNPRQPPHVKQTKLRITNQFHPAGELSVDTVKPDRLLVPTAKSLAAPPPPPDPASHDVDHYKCYKIRVTPGTPKFVPQLSVSVGDQFTAPPKLYDIKKPTRLCTPVLDKEHPAGTHTLARHPEVHLMCYQAALSKLVPNQPKHVPVVGIFVNNQFGPERLDTVKEQELCVPSVKTRGGDPAVAEAAAEDTDEEDD